MSLFQAIQQIQAQARAGDTEGAIDALRQLILQQPRDLHLWQLYAELASDPADLGYALHNILELDPGNRSARQRLDQLPLQVRAAPRQVQGHPVQVRSADDQQEQPTLYLPPQLMQRFGLHGGDLLQVRGADSSVIPVLVEKAAQGQAQSVSLNAQARHLLAVEDGGEIALLPDETLLLLMDCSSSMDYALSTGVSRLQGTQQAIRLLLEAKAQSSNQDAVGLMSFNSMVRLLRSPSQDYPALRAAAQKMRAIGATDMQAGLQQALQHLNTYGGLKRIILLTDGVPTLSDDAAVLQRAKQARSAAVVIDTIGIGRPGQRDYNEALLRAIAEITGGSFRHVQDLQTLQQSFLQLALEKTYLLTD